MKWKIVTDSSADIRNIPNLSENIEFESIPFLITIDDTTFEDTEDLDIQSFMDKMDHSHNPSKSACPSPHTFMEAFGDADNIICFTISSNLSGSYNSACVAKEHLLESQPEANVYIMDTRTASVEIKLLIEKTNELINAGLSFEEVVKEIQTYHQHTKINYILSSTDNLVKNGRMNKVLSAMIGVLGIHLIGNRTDEGVIQLASKAKGVNRSVISALHDMEKDGFIGGKVEIAHALAEDFAQKMKQKITDKYQDCEVLIQPAGALCSYYAQRGGLIIGYETK